MDEHLVTELIALERRIAADEFMITLARSADGAGVNKVTLVEDLQRRIAATASRLDALRVQLAETVEPTPAQPATAEPAKTAPPKPRAKRPRAPKAPAAERAAADESAALAGSADTAG